MTLSNSFAPIRKLAITTSVLLALGIATSASAQSIRESEGSGWIFAPDASSAVGADLTLPSYYAGGGSVSAPTHPLAFAPSQPLAFAPAQPTARLQLPQVERLRVLPSNGYLPAGFYQPQTDGQFQAPVASTFVTPCHFLAVQNGLAQVFAGCAVKQQDQRW